MAAAFCLIGKRVSLCGKFVWSFTLLMTNLLHKARAQSLWNFLVKYSSIIRCPFYGWHFELATFKISVNKNGLWLPRQRCLKNTICWYITIMPIKRYKQILLKIQIVVKAYFTFSQTEVSESNWFYEYSLSSTLHKVCYICLTNRWLVAVDFVTWLTQSWLQWLGSWRGRSIFIVN